MAVTGIGIDLVEVARIRRAVEGKGRRFLERVYTARELEFCLPRANRYLSLAARFAAKEAFLKAIGTGISRQVSWQDIEVLDNEHSVPSMRITGGAAGFLGNRRALLSLTHTVTHAAAVVVLEVLESAL